MVKHGSSQEFSSNHEGGSNMIKKSVVSILTVSALTVSGTSVFASTNVVQNQTGKASVKSVQGAAFTGDINLQQNQDKSKNISQVSLGSFGIAGQGQAGSVTGVQVQSATTSGPAVLTQSLLTKLKLTDQQSAGSSQQNVKTSAVNSLQQSTGVTGPSQVVQAQIDHTAAIQFQGSVAGGPAVQYQQAQRTSVQYQNTVKSVSP